MQPIIPAARRMSVWVATATLAAAPLALSLDAAYRRIAGPPPSALDLLRRVSVGDAAGPRLSVDAPPPDSSTSADVFDVTGRVGQMARERGDLDALHAAALIDLRWGPRSTRVVDGVVNRLSTLDPLTRQAPLLSDLAAAHLARFALEREARTLLRAIEAADRALALDSAYLPARYNLTLALDQLGLLEEAAREGHAYLARDATSHWSRTIRDVVRRNTAPPAVPPPTPASSMADVARFARREHERARQLGWNVGLAQWSAQVASGDSAGAERSLRFADALGRALRADGGDGTLADAVAEIRAGRHDPAAYAAAVAAHGFYAAGQRAFQGREFERAATLFGRALAVRDRPRTVDGWARVFRGSSLVNSGRSEAGARLLRAAIAGGDTLAHPGLVGRAHLSLSTATLRLGQDDATRAALVAAERLLRRAGERQSVGAAYASLLESTLLRGDADEGYAVAARALAALRDERHIAWRHHALLLLAREASASGLARAAARCQDESVAAAAGGGLPFDLAEARLARARLRLDAGRRDDAARDVDAARALVATIPEGNLRDWSRADLAQTTSLMQIATRPADAVASVDSAIAFARATGNVLRLARALPIRAEAQAAAGAPDSSLADLDRTIALFGARAARLSSAFERAAFLRQARHVLDRLVLLRLAHGETATALRELDRIRAMVSAVSTESTVGATGPATSATLPTFDDATALVYARIGDTLVVWSVSHGVVRAARTRVDAAHLDALLARTRAALELGQADDVVRPLLAELFDVLVRPVADRLGPAERPLVIVADGELGAVPFAALYDARRSRHLVEDRPLRFAGSLREAAAPPPVAQDRARGRDGGDVVIVADPAFAPRRHPALARLAGAAAEARTLATVYPRHTMLQGAAAEPPAVVAALRRAAVVHYAGHAVFDESRPDRSYLVLAGADSGRLSATDIAQLRLGNVRLVALSSCQTVGAQRDAIGGIAGLAGAFRAAGVLGVVGSTWAVDDALTQPLLVAFHRSYAVSGDGPRALRDAQLGLLRSTSAALRSPSAWAPFRFVGS